MNIKYGPYIDVIWTGPESGQGQFVSLAQLACDLDDDPNKILEDFKRVKIVLGNRTEFEAKGKRFQTEEDAVNEHKKPKDKG